MSLFDDYRAWAHGSRIELVNGKLVVGKSLSHSRLLLHQILRGWGLEAAISLAPELMWWSALSAAFAPDLDLETLTPLSLQTWADQIQFQPDIPPVIETWSWKRSNLQQDLRMALYGLDRRFNLGDAIGGGVVNRLGQNGLMPESYFHQGLSTQKMYDYYLDGAANLVVEFLSPGFESYDRIEKRALYESAGVSDYWLLDVEHEVVELYQLIHGVYQRRFPDEHGRYPVSSIPGLTFLPSQLWQPQEERQFPPENDLFEVAEDAPTVEQIRSQGNGIDWRRERVFVVSLEPNKIAFEDYIYWCPETKFEFVDGRPDIGGREGIRGLTGMLLMTLGLREVVRLFDPQDWVAALLKIREQQQNDAQRRGEWQEIAHQAAEILRERYAARRVAISGDLATTEPLNFWSELVLVVWDLPTSGGDFLNPHREIWNLSNDPKLRLIEAEDCTSEVDQPFLDGPLLDI